MPGDFCVLFDWAYQVGGEHDHFHAVRLQQS